MMKNSQQVPGSCKSGACFLEFHTVFLESTCDWYSVYKNLEKDQNPIRWDLISSFSQSWPFLRSVASVVTMPKQKHQQMVRITFKVLLQNTLKDFVLLYSRETKRIQNSEVPKFLSPTQRQILSRDGGGFFQFQCWETIFTLLDLLQQLKARTQPSPVQA